MLSLTWWPFPWQELINVHLVVCWKEPDRGLDADLSWFIEDCNMAALRDHIRLNDRYLWTDDISSIVPPALLPISSIGSMALSWTAKSMFNMDILNSELAKLAEGSRADHQRYSNDITLRCNGQLLKWTPYLMCCQSWSGPLMDRISPMNMSAEQARKRRRRAGWFDWSCLFLQVSKSLTHLHNMCDMLMMLLGLWAH